VTPEELAAIKHRPRHETSAGDYHDIQRLVARIEELEAERENGVETVEAINRSLRKRVEELEAALRDIVASGAYPEAAIASSALGGES
jgi:hypothetical protein